MDIHVQSAPGVAVLHIEGIINSETLHRLSRQLEEAIGRDCVHVVLELSKARILLSSGISFFIDAHDMAEQAEGKLHLANVTKEIGHLLKVARVNDFLGEGKPLGDVLAELGVSADDLQDGWPEGERHSTGLFSPAAVPEKDVGAASKPGKASAGKSKAEKADSKPELSDEDIQKLIQQYMPGRLMVDIVDHFVGGRKNTASAEDIAKHLGQKPKEITRLMKQLEKRGLLKPMGGGLYNFAPPEGENKNLQAFFRRWRNSQDHSRLLMMVLAAEG